MGLLMYHPRFPSDYLAYIWRTASVYLYGTYWVPSEYLVNMRPMRENHTPARKNSLLPEREMVFPIPEHESNTSADDDDV